MSFTTGFRARRLSSGLTIQQLSEKSGLSPYIIRRCEEGEFDEISLCRIITLADTLGISLEDGCRLARYTGGRQRPRSHAPRNVLENYMACHDLTLQGMAVLLGVSVQTAAIQCSKDEPSVKYIWSLANAEGMTVSAFVTMYSAMKCA